MFHTLRPSCGCGGGSILRRSWGRTPYRVSVYERPYRTTSFITNPERDGHDRVHGRGQKIEKLKQDQKSFEFSSPAQQPNQKEDSVKSQSGIGRGKIAPPGKDSTTEPLKIDLPASAIIERLTARQREKASMMPKADSEDTTDQPKEEDQDLLGSIFQKIVSPLYQPKKLPKAVKDQKVSPSESIRKKELESQKRREEEEGQFEDAVEDMGEIKPKKEELVVAKRFDEKELQDDIYKWDVDQQIDEESFDQESYDRVPMEESLYDEAVLYKEQDQEDEYSEGLTEEVLSSEMFRESEYQEDESIFASEDPNALKRMKKVFESFEKKKQRLLKERRGKKRRTLKLHFMDRGGRSVGETLTFEDEDMEKEDFTFKFKEELEELEEPKADRKDVEKGSLFQPALDSQETMETEPDVAESIQAIIKAEDFEIGTTVKRLIAQMGKRVLSSYQKKQMKEMKIKQKKEKFLTRIKEKYAEQIKKEKAAKAERQKKQAEERERIKSSSDYYYYPEIDYYVPKRILEHPVLLAGFATVLDNPSWNVKQKRYYVSRALEILQNVEKADEKVRKFVEENFVIKNVREKEKDWRHQPHNLKIPIYNWNQLLEGLTSRFSREDMVGRYTSSTLIKRFVETQKPKKLPLLSRPTK